MATDFKERVLSVVRNITPGQVMSYGEVARRAKSPRAARAVAYIMADNYDLAVPCHRVIRADGQPGGYNRGGEPAKRRLLRSEGVIL